jgi:hypothetical protein
MISFFLQCPFTGNIEFGHDVKFKGKYKVYFLGNRYEFRTDSERHGNKPGEREKRERQQRDY